MRKLILVACALLALTGCITPKSYVDTALGDTSLQALAKPAQPQPYQLLFEFRTKGAANTRATGFVRPILSEEIAKSGLLGVQSETPVAKNRQLVITIDNISLTDNVAAKGFGVGLTFGLAGTMVTDGYVAEASYSIDGKAPVKVEVKHALHTTIGNASGPAGVPALVPADAAKIVFQQIARKILSDLAPAIVTD